ncbi:DUF1559 domain-containing protein [Gimesia chilikensis]|uniref:DUF1559 family PulG-like putative transporter n=1 Tax=Gimesia chilikensis TaxID=2605989 RepID=UPI0011EBBDB3|nr:DUF1559 domain-containing protein [Gimesia chilikensis]KAA0134425.1 DUF1559 domain-containing protein [Gimesia chilikensis]
MKSKLRYPGQRKAESLSETGQLRAGFTIIELLVATAVIGILIALALPAIQTARSSARQLQCLNNMRNVGLAILQETDSANRFPACGYYGDGTPATFGQYRSWVVDILPYLDQSNIFTAWDFDLSCKDPVNVPLASTHIAVLTCPDDFSVIPGQGNLSYVLNSGIGFTAEIAGIHDCPVGPQSGKLDLNGNGITCNSSTSGDGTPSDRELFFHMGLFYNETWKGETRAERHYTIAGITDGTSNTMLISENIRTGYDPASPTSNWASPSPFLTSFYIGNPCQNGSCSAGNVDYNRANSGTSAINAGLKQPEGAAPFPNSLHAGGVNVGYCDGHFEFLSENIDGKVYASLASPQGQSLSGTSLEQ